ncbi:MAG TPA: hypothetical protein VMF06_16275, partial [Candidatus Limnocylindria bacterium]|nr:hypothetical protein [Candidatus Limnocylindria bacterium]
MNNKQATNKAKKATKQGSRTSAAATPVGKKYEIVKLGLDVHRDSIRVVRMVDNSRPQPAQKYSPE